MTGLTAAAAAAEARRDIGTLTSEAAAAEAPIAETAPAVMPQPQPEVRSFGGRFGVWVRCGITRIVFSGKNRIAPGWHREDHGFVCMHPDG